MKSIFSVARWAMLLAIAFFAAPELANGQTKLSIQGILKQNDGAAVDNGLYDLTFKLYTVQAGGTAIWTETQMGLKVTGGIYSTQLGEVNPLNVPFDVPYFLGVTVAGEEMSPRTQLSAAPYALSLLGSDNKFPATGPVLMGSLATGTEITTATSYTAAANDHVIYLDHTANQNVTLPAATTDNTGRQLLLVNKEAVAKTLTASNYVNLAGATSTTVPATGVVELQSDGSVWRQTGGYVQPVAAQAKAFVRLHKATQTIPVVTSPGMTALSYNEISDAQNCWNPTTHTFTAPRTGVYQISGSFYVSSPTGGAICYVSLTDFNASFITHYTWPSEKSTPFSFSYPMTAGETFQIRMHTANGAPNINAGNSSFLTVMEY